MTPNYRQKDFVFTAHDNHTLGKGQLQSALSIKRFNASVWGQGTNEQSLTPTVEAGNYFATQDRRSHRFELFEFYEFPAKQFLGGSHEIKIGLDLNSVSNRMNYGAPPVNIVRADGTVAERITFGTASSIRESNREYVGFVQDRWMVRQNLSFDLGVRYEDQHIADEQNLAPRAGFAWSPFMNDRTIIRGDIGLFFDKVPLNIRSFARYPRLSKVERSDRSGVHQHVREPVAFEEPSRRSAVAGDGASRRK